MSQRKKIPKPEKMIATLTYDIKSIEIKKYRLNREHSIRSTVFIKNSDNELENNIDMHIPGQVKKSSEINEQKHEEIKGGTNIQG